MAAKLIGEVVYHWRVTVKDVNGPPVLLRRMLFPRNRIWPTRKSLLVRSGEIAMRADRYPTRFTSSDLSWRVSINEFFRRRGNSVAAARPEIVGSELIQGQE